ncbi:hypothetical protein LINGRAHAP2_LOCUS15567, partial [Linum grandiflorum]
LPLAPTNDCWIWHYAINGEYKVKSGYRLSRDLTSTKRNIKFGPALLHSSDWTKLWSLPIQPKLKFFMWKVFHDVLPIKEALQQRSVVIDALCPVCGIREESLFHLFFECIVARQLSMTLNCPELLTRNHHPVSLWRQCHLRGNSYAIKLIYFWWRLWKSRNSVVFEALQHSIAALARQFTAHFREANVLLHQHSISTTPQLVPCTGASTAIWLPRHPDFTLFSDAATQHTMGIQAGYGSIGLVVFDAVGSLAQALGHVIRHITDVLHLEVFGIRAALHACHPWRSNTCIICSDSLEAVRLLHSHSMDTRLGTLLTECRDLLHNLPMVFLHHIPRRDNRAAHLVAREALCYPDNTHRSLDLRYVLH